MEHTAETAAKLTNQALVGALMARSRAEGGSSNYWHHHPQMSHNTSEMGVLKEELLRRLPSETRQSR